MSGIGRRRFIVGLGSASVAWPLGATAQQSGKIRRIGLLMNFHADEAEGQARLMAFTQGLRKLGWTDGNNLHLDIRWAADEPDLYRQYAAELVALAPDVILAAASPSVAALQRVNRTVPIVFASVIDPVGAGFVTSLARPGGNATGFAAFEYSIGGKWLELLSEIAPTLRRVAVLRDTALAAGIGQFAAIQAMAPPSFAAGLSTIDMRDHDEIERAVTAFATEPNGCLIVTASPLAVTHRDLILSLATRYRLPNIYPFRYYPERGGLASYGPDPNDEFARAAAYVDRVLNGEKPADLPVQEPTRYQLIVNLKSAKGLGLTIPAAVVNRADEVIE